MESELNDVLARLEKLNAIGVALSAERDIDRLLESILVAAKSVTRADGGTVYLMNEAGTALRFEIMHTDSLDIRRGGTSGVPVRLPELPLKGLNGEPNNQVVAVHAALSDKTINIPDVNTAQGYDFTGPKRMGAITGYSTVSLLTVPMKNHSGYVIGVLQLINAQEEGSGRVVEFSNTDLSLVESMASQAAIVLSNRQLVREQERLFESLITLVNEAIDEKSAHTGGHCQRVPRLTMMLAEATHGTTEGALSGFRMDEAGRYELRIAGMLHDCGKITTPVHVVDKATKLQTLYDRIGLIDTRFEVLRRDAEIDALRRRLAAREGETQETDAQIATHLADDLALLTEEQAFLRRCNRGSEAMQAEDLARVAEISQRRKWRFGGDGAASPQPFLSPDELENLSIRAGTLTGEERRVINQHISSTIRMLEKLPWPDHLKRVPEFAGGHHERMDGKGYPRGLKASEMSIQARIMAIADIFEALTASDRPYKSPMKISQAMDILCNFATTGHIDPDLFEVFVRRRVYERYADEFLAPAQVDDVNDVALLEKVRAFRAQSALTS